MKTLAIFCPTYKRPHTLVGVAKNIEDTTKSSFTLYFGIEPEDKESIKAAKATKHKVIINKYEPSYPNAIQSIYEASKEPFFIHVNDDFEFSQDWDEAPLSMFENENLMVVGMKQAEGDTHGSAISMVRRKYIEEQSGVMDMPNRVFYPYPHHYCDTEFTRTAQKRGVWALCGQRTITHLHPGFTGADKDETYLKNDATSEIAHQMFDKRQHLWA